MQQRIKLDPLAYVLILTVLATQIYTSFLKGPDVERVIEQSDRDYQSAVFDSNENKGVIHQVFRQNEVDRALLKAALRACAQ